LKLATLETKARGGAVIVIMMKIIHRSSKRLHYFLTHLLLLFSFSTPILQILSKSKKNYEMFQKGTKNFLTIGKDFRYNGIKESAIVKLRWRDF